jgi:hypothetical protein
VFHFIPYETPKMPAHKYVLQRLTPILEFNSGSSTQKRRSERSGSLELGGKVSYCPVQCILCHYTMSPPYNQCRNPLQNTHLVTPTSTTWSCYSNRTCGMRWCLLPAHSLDQQAWYTSLYPRSEISLALVSRFRLV